MFSKFIKTLTLIVLVIGIASFNSLEAEAADSRVMWGNTELKPGQIGKITVLKDTPLYTIVSGTTLTSTRKLKKGESYRVYQYKNQNGGLYGVGGSGFVMKDSNIKYETPPKSKLALVKDNVIKSPKPTLNTIMENLVKDVIGDSYEIGIHNDGTISLNGKKAFQYGSDSREGKKYFMILDTTKVSESYKLMNRLGLNLSEDEFKKLIKQSSDSGSAYNKDELFIKSSKSMIHIRWK